MNFMIGEGHYDVRLKLHSRNKKHTMYVPLSVNANKQYRFNIMLEDIKAYLPKKNLGCFLRSPNRYGSI